MSQDRENNQFVIHSLISNRWSPRAFKEKAPDKEQLLTVLEAARWAPSSNNEQPWRFILGVKGRGETYDKILKCLNEFNEKWASSAPVLLLVCGKKHFSHNNAENKHFMYDSGAAMANLCLQATNEGLVVHQMAGFSPDKARELFNIPDEYNAFTAGAIGFLGEPDELSEEHQKSEVAKRNRKPLSELVFEDEWENSFG